MNEQGLVLTGSPPGASKLLAALILDRPAGELHGEGGIERIDPKVMQVFAALLDAGGEVVSRETLLETAWPGAAVSDEVLTRCIYALRRHLAGAGGNESYRNLLETLPKRGYRLNLAPQLATPATAPRGAARRPASLGPVIAATVAALGVLAVVAWLFILPRDTAPDETANRPAAESPLAIAVLPFINMSADPNEQYFADGLSEELINLLARTLDIRVIARTSSFAFRDSSADIGSIAARLGVSHLLEGSVRKDGDRLRITAQLVDARDDSHVWSETFDRHANDRFAVQDEIATAVARALHLEFASASVPQAVPTTNPLAHEAFLRGRFLHHRRAPGDVARALDYFEEAVRIDPDFALAWANVAGALYVLEDEEGITNAATQAKRRVAVERALTLGPDLAEVHARAAQYYADTNQEDLAEEHFRKALSLDPESPLILSFLASRAAWRGDFERAVALQRQVLTLDPLSSVNAANLVGLLLAAGRAKEAEAELQKLSTERGSLRPDTSRDLANAMILQGRIDDARALVDSWPEGNERAHFTAMLLHMLGRREEADQALARLDDVPGLEGAIRRAEVLVLRGDLDAAFEELDALRQYIGSDKPTFPDFRWADRARHSPYLNPSLASDPRWAALWETRLAPW